MTQEFENEFFSVTNAFFNKIITLAIDKLRVGGKEVSKNDYALLSKTLKVSEKELRRISMKPQSLTIRQAMKLANALGLSIILTVQGQIKQY